MSGTVVGRTAWIAYAACVQRPARSLPWSTDTDQVPAVLVDLMRENCAGCPVRLACAAYVVSENITGGFWAGLDRSQPQPVSELPVPVAQTVQLLLPLDFPDDSNDVPDQTASGRLGGVA